MNGLLKFSSLIDRINTRIGQGAAWLMLIAVVISAGNAMIRYSWPERFHQRQTPGSGTCYW